MLAFDESWELRKIEETFYFGKHFYIDGNTIYCNPDHKIMSLDNKSILMDLANTQQIWIKMQNIPEIGIPTDF